MPTNPKSQVPSPDPQYLFYGGKGGVGKTTCAAARAVAEAARGTRVLVVSTDPAHSLGDALGVRLSATPRPITLQHRNADHRNAFALRSGVSDRRRNGSLKAVELDAPRAFARWLAEHRHALGDIVEHGTWLDRQDADALLDLPIPGVDELVGLVEITRMATLGAYDVVIVDTAPTGHTLRLLAAPETVASVAAILDALQESHRVIREQFARRGRPETADRLIALIAGEARDAGERLRDRERTAFEWVLLPEALSLAESADGLAALDRARIPVREVIVNRMIPDGVACPICDRRRASERQIVARIPRTLGAARRVRLLAADIREPRGVTALAAIGRRLIGDGGDGVTGPPLHERSAGTGLRVVPHAGVRTAAATGLRVGRSGSLTVTPQPRAQLESLDAFRGAQLLFFGGKGGVGKTTVAAASAVRLARADPSRRVLLLSTDPAHSLADVLGQPVGDHPVAIRGGPPNLHVRELDASAAFISRRTDLEAALGEVMAAFGDRDIAGGGSAQQAVARLMDLAPPGIDELFGMLTVVEAQRTYPLIVVDTAPTGHALRLLEMPEAARAWVQALLRVLLKYRSIVHPGHLAAELVALSKSIRELQDRVRDAAATRFIVVTRAADVPRRETDRLLDRLRRLHLVVPALVVNARTMTAGACRRCRATMAAEAPEAAVLQAHCRRKLRQCVIIQTPLTAPPPRGIAALDRWARGWTVDA